MVRNLSSKQTKPIRNVRCLCITVLTDIPETMVNRGGERSIVFVLVSQLLYITFAKIYIFFE